MLRSIILPTLVAVVITSLGIVYAEPGPIARPPFAGVRDALIYRGAEPAIQVGGIFPGAVTIGQAVADAVPATSTDTITIASLSHLQSSSSTDTVAHMAHANASTASAAVWGQNIIARSELASAGAKLVGQEIDIMPGAPVGPDSGGVFLNAFGHRVPVAIQTGGPAGGSWGNGIVLGGIDGAGIAVPPGESMKSAINVGQGSYTEAAIVAGNQSGGDAAHFYGPVCLDGWSACIEIGEPDSCGKGYRCLRIAN